MARPRRPLVSLTLAALVACAGLVSTAGTAEAGTHATRWATYVEAVQAATASTTTAGVEWSGWNAVRDHFMERMRTENATGRSEAKREAQRWLRNVQRLLNGAVQDHVRAIRALDAFTHFAGTTPEQAAARESLKSATSVLRAHSAEITNLIQGVGRMK